MLKRMNAMTPLQARLLVKMLNNEPISPKSTAILNEAITSK